MCTAIVVACADSGGSRPETYTVKPQDTLYSIAWRNNIDFKALAAWNHLGSSPRIYTGQVLLLHSSRGAPTGSTVAPVRRSDPKTNKPSIPVSGSWVWPTLRIGQPTAVTGGGLLMTGELGQAVCAASAGKVVYVGSGLRAYGNLAIIKHSDGLLSAYAHNLELSVKEGESVQAGQRIGSMGMGPHQKPALYFEIRLNGKPVNVLPFLNLK